MKSILIKLTKIEDVKKFVNTVSKYDYDIDLISGRYAIDAKSIMGIFSLDLSKEMKLIAHTEDATQLFEELSEFVH